MRLIALSDGTRDQDSLIVFETNAPVEILKKLEKQSCDVFLSGSGCYDDVPIWRDVLTEQGYEFNCIDSQFHTIGFKTSEQWLKDDFPDITEKYVIENQPRSHEAFEIESRVLVNTILDCISKLQRMSNDNRYSYTGSDINKIFPLLKKKLNYAESVFVERLKQDNQ